MSRGTDTETCLISFIPDPFIAVAIIDTKTTFDPYHPRFIDCSLPLQDGVRFVMSGKLWRVGQANKDLETGQFVAKL